MHAGVGHQQQFDDPAGSSGAACAWRSLLPGYASRTCWAASTAPEGFRLNGQHIAVFLRIPTLRSIPLKPFQSALEECLIFCIGDVGETAAPTAHFAQFSRSELKRGRH